MPEQFEQLFQNGAEIRRVRRSLDRRVCAGSGLADSLQQIGVGPDEFFQAGFDGRSGCPGQGLFQIGDGFDVLLEVETPRFENAPVLKSYFTYISGESYPVNR